MRAEIYMFTTSPASFSASSPASSPASSLPKRKQPEPVGPFSLVSDELNGSQPYPAFLFQDMTHSSRAVAVVTMSDLEPKPAAKALKPSEAEEKTNDEPKRDPTVVIFDVSDSMNWALPDGRLEKPRFDLVFDPAMMALHEVLGKGGTVVVSTFSEPKRAGVEMAWCVQFFVPPTFSRQDLENAVLNALHTLRTDEVALFDKQIDRNGVLVCEPNPVLRPGFQRRGLCNGRTEPDHLFEILGKTNKFFPDANTVFLGTDADMSVSQNHPLRQENPLGDKFLYTFFAGVINDVERLKDLPLCPKDREKLRKHLFVAGQDGDAATWAAGAFADNALVVIQTTGCKVRVSGTSADFGAQCAVRVSLPAVFIVEPDGPGPCSLRIRVGNHVQTYTFQAVGDLPQKAEDHVLNALLATRALKSVASNLAPDTAGEAFTRFSGGASTKEVTHLFAQLEQVTIARAEARFGGVLPIHLSAMFKELMQEALQAALVPVQQREAQARRLAAQAAESEKRMQNLLGDVKGSNDAEATARALLQGNQNKLTTLATKIQAEEAKFKAAEGFAEEVAQQAVQLMKGEINDADANKLTTEQKSTAHSYRPGNPNAAVVQNVNRNSSYVRRRKDPMEEAEAQLRKAIRPPGLSDTLDGLKSTVSDLEEMQALLREFLEGQDRGAKAGATDEAKASSERFDMAALFHELADIGSNECMICAVKGTQPPLRVCSNAQCQGEVCGDCTYKLKKRQRACPFCRNPLL